MNTLRHVLVVALALASVSAAPTGAQQNDATPQRNAERLDEARRQTVKRSSPQAPAPDDQGRLDAMRRAFTDLGEENGKLRKENKDLHADNNALNQKLREAEKLLRQWQASRNALEVPPQPAPGQGPNEVPPTWRPFEFNGATYYVVPLKADSDNEGTKTNTLMQVEPARPPAPAK